MLRPRPAGSSLAGTAHCGLRATKSRSTTTLAFTIPIVRPILALGTTPSSMATKRTGLTLTLRRFWEVWRDYVPPNDPYFPLGRAAPPRYLAERKFAWGGN